MRIRPGSYAILSAKAQQIVGGFSNSASVDSKDPAVAALGAGRVDIVIGYCTSAKLRLSQMAELQVTEVPRDIATGPEYGLAVLRGADPGASDLALFMLSPDGQQIFARVRICAGRAAGAGALNTIRHNQRLRLRRLRCYALLASTDSASRTQ